MVSAGQRMNGLAITIARRYAISTPSIWPLGVRPHDPEPPP
jgi:hypothetical protein